MAEESIDDIYGGNFLKTSDLPRNGVLECKIKAVRVDKVGRGEDARKKILLDLESGKVFVVNKTNAERLSKNFRSSTYSSWTGKTFKVKVGETQYSGKDVEAMRVVKEYED